MSIWKHININLKSGKRLKIIGDGTEGGASEETEEVVEVELEVDGEHGVDAEDGDDGADDDKGSAGWGDETRKTVVKWAMHDTRDGESKMATTQRISQVARSRLAEQKSLLVGKADETYKTFLAIEAVPTFV